MKIVMYVTYPRKRLLIYMTIIIAGTRTKAKSFLQNIADLKFEYKNTAVFHYFFYNKTKICEDKTFININILLIVFC